MNSSKLKLSILSPLVALSLGACVDQDDFDDFGGGSANYGDQFSEGERLELVARNAEPTPSDQMPTSGTAQYQGIAQFGDNQGDIQNPNGPRFNSKMTLTADFGNETVGGRLYDFEASERMEASDVSGELAITDGTIQSVNGDAGFSAKVGGTLSGAGESFTVSGTAEGGFGDDASVLSGKMVLTDDGEGGDQPTYGQFSTERQ